MGEVYQALTPKGERVALKVLVIPHSFYVKQFEDEARLLIRLRHTSLVSVLGYELKSEKIFGEEKGPCFWMEYVEGEDLLTAAKKVGARGSPPLKIFDWLRQALEALQYLHSQSILHGDISPNNVLIDLKGCLRLLDFGLAGAEGVSSDHMGGTLLYVAPERIDGIFRQAGDLFSLGMLFYEGLSGKHPREGCASFQELAGREPRPLLEERPDLGEEFSIAARVIDRMIQADLSQRLGTAKETLEALKGGKKIETSLVSSEYHSAKMLGSDEFFGKVHRALSELSSNSSIFGLHGITGVGKSRFLRECGFHCSFLGIPLNEVTPARWKEAVAELSDSSAPPVGAYFFSSLESHSLADLSPLIRLLREGFPEKGFFAVFEWNDDRLSEETGHFLSSFLKFPEIEEIHLKNLNRENSFDLVKGGLGEGPAEEIAESLFIQTGGNPRMLLELIELLRERQIASKKHFSRDWLEGLKNFHSFEDILLDRLMGLGGKEVKILTYLSAADRPVSSRSLGRALPMASEELKKTLQKLISRQLVASEASADQYSLSIPSLKEALLKKITGPRRNHP